MAKEGQVRTVNIFLGFFFVVNFCLGTGFLGVPYAFLYSGTLVSAFTLALIATISWTNANYLLEVMARAQALEYFNKTQRPSHLDVDSDSDEKSKAQGVQSINRDWTHPTFEITVRRKFEVVELCEIFFNRWVKILYLIILSIYCFLASWSFATVAGSSWALNLPYNFSGVLQCDGDLDPFHHSVLPTPETCRNAYYFSLFLFAILVVSLSLLDLKEQAIIQMILGLLRFLTVGAIIVYSLAKIAGGGDACTAMANAANDSDIDSLMPLHNATVYTSYRDMLVRFDVESWLAAIPIFTYAFILHQGLASLTHPIKQKQYLWYLTLAMFGTAVLCYMSLGVIVPFWFKDSIQETVTLNFSGFTSAGNSLGLRVLAYYLLLFPSLDVVSAYPLMVHTVVNNFYIIIVGHDTSRPAPRRYRWLDFTLRISLRLIVAVVPILAAFSVANLIYVLKYAGLMGFCICFFFPTILQARSIYVCKRTFVPNQISISGADRNEEQRSLLSSLSPTGAETSSRKHSLLSTRELKGKEKLSMYMTPYSSRCWSHWLVILVVAVLGGCLFILALASLGVHPVKRGCGLVPETEMNRTERSYMYY